MKFKVEAAALSKIDADILVLCVSQGEDLSALALGKNFTESVRQCAEAEGFVGRSGQMLYLPTYGALPSKRLCLYGTGTKGEPTASCLRKLASALAKKTHALVVSHIQASEGKTKKSSKHSHDFSVCFYLRDKKDAARQVEIISEAWIMSSFSFLKYKSSKEDERRKQAQSAHLTIGFGGLTKASFDGAIKKGTTVGEAVSLARELIAEPPSVMTPSRLAQEARRIAKDFELGVKVLDTPQIEKLGMGSFLGVARGAKEPPKFIVLKYTAPKATKTVALIGKGITFDSGGLSLKPAASMEHMKYDMAGAAAVLGAMQVVGILRPKVSVLAVIAATENMPGSNALHPGDILKSMNGKTIEVNNTDAEGRLILADAITYALGEGVDEIIDIATLTGAVVTALGRVAAGIMGSSQELVDKVIASGKDSGEQFWQLPLFEEYKEALKSDVADLKNAGSRGEAGSSCAGMFLKEFAGEKPWVHMDIAGVGWLDREKDELCKGGTGFGVRTMCNYVLSQ